MQVHLRYWQPRPFPRKPLASHIIFLLALIPYFPLEGFQLARKMDQVEREQCDACRVSRILQPYLYIIYYIEPCNAVTGGWGSNIYPQTQFPGQIWGIHLIFSRSLWHITLYSKMHPDMEFGWGDSDNRAYMWYESQLEEANERATIQGVVIANHISCAFELCAGNIVLFGPSHSKTRTKTSSLRGMGQGSARWGWRIDGIKPARWHILGHTTL